MQINYKLSSREYAKVAGSDWPLYADYIKGKLNDQLVREIEEYENKFYIEKQTNSVELINKKYHSINLFWFNKYFLFSLLPAAIAIWLFVSIDGTVEKFIILFFFFRFKKEFWTIIVHKWLCHGQFEPTRWARPLLLFMVVVGSRASPTHYIQSHWAHHQDQDTELDPYPPTWGLLNLILLGGRHYKKYPLRRWLTAPDIKFVLRNLVWLRIIYWTAIAFIDLDILILSFFFMNFYDRLSNGLESYLYHDGHRTQQPIDKYPFIGYPIILFLGSSWMHASHSNRPWQFNCSKSNPNLIDLEYQFLRIFAANEKE